MKEIRQKKDKGVSAIIATILLIAITVVLAATLVTILGGFTHGVSNSVVTVGATTQEVHNGTTNYFIYFNVSSSSSNLSASQITVEINGASAGTLAAPSGLSAATTNPAFLTGGSDFVFHTTSDKSVTSFNLIYKGNSIYSSGSISVI